MWPARLPVFLALLAVVGVSVPAARAGTKPRVYTLRVGQLFSASGQTGRPIGEDAPATGTVVVRGQWTGGTWRVILKTKTDIKGHYRFKVRPARRGTLTLRVDPPDHVSQRFVLHVR